MEQGANNKTLSEWLEYIEAIHPKSIEFGLERVWFVYQSLFPEGVPYPVITVAGTNGKGSCCAYIESILQASGKVTGKYTSPHLVRFNERIVVDNKIVSNDFIISAFERIESARKDIVLTYFEYTTLAAMLVFADQAIEIGIVEVGLGGRLDAVNILDPIVSVITSIGIDHVDWLGNDRELIGLEKAAVARSGRPCIVGEANVPESVKQYLIEISALPKYIGNELEIVHFDEGWQIIEDGMSVFNVLPILKNNVDHQYRNAVCAILAVLNANFDVNEDAIIQGLHEVAVEGRCQLLSFQPLIVLDVAHNEDSVLALREYINQLSFTGRCYAVFSMLHDKDINRCIDLIFDIVDEWHIAPLDLTRSSSVDELNSAVNTIALCHKKKNHLVKSYRSIKEAFIKVKNVVNSDDCVIVFGSFHVVGDILSIN